MVAHAARRRCHNKIDNLPMLGRGWQNAVQNRQLNGGGQWEWQCWRPLAQNPTLQFRTFQVKAKPQVSAVGMRPLLIYWVDMCCRDGTSNAAVETERNAADHTSGDYPGARGWQQHATQWHVLRKTCPNTLTSGKHGTR